MRHRWVVLAVFLTGCGSEAGTADAPPDSTAPPVATSGVVTDTAAPVAETAAATTDESTTTAAPTTVAPTTAPSDPATVPGSELVGRWAHYDVVAYQDELIKTLIVSYGFNDFTVDDGRLVDQGSFCFSEQRTDQPVETSLSDAATQAIRPPPTPVEVDTTGDVLTIRRPATPTPVGIRLVDPANERLPTDPGDPRIVDDDGDGEPGITVTIRVSDDLSGELYIARREIFAYEARLVTPDRLEGTVTDDSEQLVIGASDPIFLTESNWVQHPDPAKSPILLIRVDDSWDCERLATERAALFPPTPDVDW